MVFNLILGAVLTYYGGTFDSSTTNRPSAGRMYPVSARAYRLVQPDGQRRLFEVVDARQGLLKGAEPWVGRVARNQIDVWTDPDKTGGRLRTGYTFLNGQLRQMQLDGVTYRFPGGALGEENGLAELFPEEGARETEKGSSGDIWKNDANRLRLWFANPNSAGLLVAQFLLGVLCLAVWLVTRRRTGMVSQTLWRVGYSVLAALALALTYVLMRTGSRGALLALVCGGFCFALPWLRRLATKRGILSVLGALAVLASISVVSGQGGRLAKTFTQVDKGNSLRLKVAKAAIQLFADAPSGWEGGEAPARSACLNWYVFDENRTIRTHLLTVAELGWSRGWLYWWCWFVLLGFGVWALCRRRPEPMAFGFSFFLAGFLNPVYREWELWVAPCIAVLWILRGAVPTKKQVMLILSSAGGLATGIVVLMLVADKCFDRTNPFSIRSAGAVTTVKSAEADVWVVEDVAVLGGFGFPGREIVTQLARHAELDGISYVRQLDDLPREVGTLILPGRRAAEYLARLETAEGAPCKAKRIVFLSPSVGPDQVPDSLLSATEIRWVAGSLAVLRQSRGYFKCARAPWVDIRRGCELYIPDWLEKNSTFGVDN